VSLRAPRLLLLPEGSCAHDTPFSLQEPSHPSLGTVSSLAGFLVVVVGFVVVVVGFDVLVLVDRVVVVAP
jgi:hypothetical protein